MSSVIASIERAQLRRVPSFAPGDRVKVHFQVIEGTRSRVQVFEGVVIKRQGHGARETFTVRKQSFGVGVERMFPLHSPKIERIELAARGDVRRAKLYYLRDRVGKRARVRERRYAGPEEVVEPGLLVEPDVAAPSAEGEDAGGAPEQEAVDTQAGATESPQDVQGGDGEAIEEPGKDEQDGADAAGDAASEQAASAASEGGAQDTEAADDSSPAAAADDPSPDAEDAEGGVAGDDPTA